MADPNSTVSEASRPRSQRRSLLDDRQSASGEDYYHYRREVPRELNKDYYKMDPYPMTPRAARFQQPADDVISFSRPMNSTGEGRARLRASKTISDYGAYPELSSYGSYNPHDNLMYNERPYLPVGAGYEPYYWVPAPPIYDHIAPGAKTEPEVAMNQVQSYYNSGEDYDIVSNDPEDEESAVHHVVKLNFPQSTDINNEITHLFNARKRAFTDQPTFGYENKIEKKEYEIVQTQLRIASNDLDHDIALLTYEDKSEKTDASRPKPETRWMYVYPLLKFAAQTSQVSQ
ncbi:Mg2+ transporter protein CorA-like/Zinc transport protein ZntB [Penicillium soppii]|uniref:Mg2+ transporter protein CorA-like/Zinc transport protein ZntB n=1 Tax=Penicillium soppii TaxID=69789 RepID=UPI0025483579|nr:Mg2+ transporter protein CorA-like/Zinc transport protein ZntB [Penicillium soppii]KAJ5872320.1 Mg2+ transporter protein CorA-like/Zinc transport protein ZntB [Penicillium soppii]